MDVPPEVSFRDIEPTPAVRQRIDDEIGKLDDLFDRIVSCRVMVEIPHKSKETGNLHRVRIEVGVPGNTLVVSRDPPREDKREDLNAAVTEAFSDMQRQIRDYAERLRGR